MKKKKRKLTYEDGYVDTICPPGSSNAVQHARYDLLLDRPKIHYWKAVLFVLLHLIVGYALALIVGILLKDNFKDMNVFAATWFFIPVLVLFALTSRFTCIFCVKMYQRYARAEVRLRCTMEPSCSHYAILAFKKYGAIAGGIKAIKRIKRCCPPGYIDYP
ncbi:MAG: membrane protein insertion efficiency factor YidD [Roseburia sp.]|nr:membrane protein insertion efficiency factor YidD [Roseburia sp.]